MSEATKKTNNNDVSNIKLETQTSENTNNIQQNKSATNTDNSVNSHPSNNSSNKNGNEKKQISKKKKVIILISIAVAFAVIVAIVVIAVVIKNKKDKKKKNKDEIKIEYDEAEKLINSEIIKENRLLLNESSINIKELISICNNVSFKKINGTVDNSYKNKDFLKNSNESSIQNAKSDLDLYHSVYTSLSEKINNLAKETSESLKSLPVHLTEFQKELDNITKQFEETIKTLAIPLSLKSNKTKRNLEKVIYFGLSTKYQKAIEKLNDYYNTYFKNISNCSENLLLSVESIHYNVEYLGDKVTSGISNFTKSIEQINEETIHAYLIKIKDSIISIQKDTKDFTSDLIEKKDKIEKNKEDNEILEVSDTEDILIYLNGLIEELKGNNNIELQIPKLTSISTFINLTELIISNIIIPIENKTIDEYENIWEISKVEISTSLDLLFLMDVTGSMSGHLDKVKTSTLSIINGVIEQCPGIDINLGFIGFRDIDEEFIDIDFTKNHSYLEERIGEIKTQGGGFDLPEDVALALEMALNKTWKSNAKFAVFIGDNPGHGANYSNLDFNRETWPERRSIEEMIKEMAENGISLFCLNITKRTDKMYSIFEDIYNRTNSNNTKFMIVDESENQLNFSEIVILSAVDVYNTQRMNKRKKFRILES